MSLKSLGEWREEIDDNPFIQSVLQGTFGEILRNSLNEYFSSGNNEVVRGAALQNRVILCGNEFGSKDRIDPGTLQPMHPELVVIGALVTTEIARVMGLTELVRAMEDEF